MKKNLWIPALILFLLAGCSTSIPILESSANKSGLTTTAQLLDRDYASAIETFYAGGEEGTFPGAADVKIYYRIFRQPGAEKGAVLISSGRTEAAIKYRELIYDLYNNGYSVYIHDHRGQGLSGRMTEDREMGYVDDFQNYVSDMKYFYDHYLVPGKHEHRYLLAHSLGGAIGMTYLEQFPDDFNAAAFSSPMLGLSPYICPLAHLLAGKTPKYAPGQSGYHNDSTAFAGNDVTGSDIRYYRNIEANIRFPEARLGGASLQWLTESCEAMKAIRRNAEDLKTPFILFAADNETVVYPKAYVKFTSKAARAGKEYQIFLVPDAQHELLMEKDAQRTDVLEKVLEFYSEHP
ncbi:MAG: alpha/beta fold hydrolase [Bacteroidota bacterium]